MDTKKQGDDAADHAPRPTDAGKSDDKRTSRQDGPNYQDREDGGRAIPAGEVNSANDE